LCIKTTIGRVVYEHFGFMIYERTGGVLQFVQREYKILGNYNKNPEVLTTSVKLDNGPVGGH